MTWHEDVRNWKWRMLEGWNWENSEKIPKKYPDIVQHKWLRGHENSNFIRQKGKLNGVIARSLRPVGTTNVCVTLGVVILVWEVVGSEDITARKVDSLASKPRQKFSCQIWGSLELTLIGTIMRNHISQSCFMLHLITRSEKSITWQRSFLNIEKDIDMHSILDMA